MLTSTSSSVSFEFKEQAPSQRGFQDALDGGGQALDFDARHGFRHAKQAALGEFVIVSSERKRPDNVVAQESGVKQLHRAGKLERKFVEDAARKHAPHAGDFLELRGGEARFGQVL